MCLCYFTTSRNVFKNLATEEFFLKCFENNILLFYCNSASVVVGRNQNIFKEVNVEFCGSNGLCIARRRSGGGCVYHDLGNLNVSLITTRRKFSKTRLLECIQSALQKDFHIPVHISERNDLRLFDRKVAGSAYRITAERAYHHTTLLVQADLWRLEEALHCSEKFTVETKATESIRSKSN
ncbi:Lipoate-protein ligase A [Galdieria sulphuraria]|nr:Lipoate-protein ligase A [Galdieria sulphuraria]